MYKIVFTLALCCSVLLGYAQTPVENERYKFYDFSIEPAIGTRFYTFLGAPDIQVSNLLQYKIKHRISIIAHTALSIDSEVSWITDVTKNYSYTVFQKIGVGVSFNSRGTSNVFSGLVGGMYNAYSGTFSNPEIPEQITTKTKSFTPDYGLMYNLKTGKRKTFFSGRLYIPLKDGVDGIIANAAMELGVGIRIK